MADLSRKYKVIATKTVRAIDKVMAETIATESFKNGTADDVRVVMLENSIADRENAYRGELPKES